MRQVARPRPSAWRGVSVTGGIAALALALGGCLPHDVAAPAPPPTAEPYPAAVAAPRPTDPRPTTPAPTLADDHADARPTAPADRTDRAGPAHRAERAEDPDPGWAPNPDWDPDPDRDPDPDGLSGELWHDPSSAAARQVRAWRAEGRLAEARLLRALADQPTAEWIGDQPRQKAHRVTESARASGRTPVLVGYHIPYRDCGNHSAGGAPDGAAYRRWAHDLAAGIGDREALVILEPDAVAQVVDGCVPAELRGERLDLLRHAVVTLSGLPGTRVYLDAGNAGWVPDPARLVPSLQRAGIAYADGFALNVSNFHTTRASVDYGHRLSRLLDDAHFVVDTSRNGRGPAEDDGLGDTWCNPPGRAIGQPPTTRTGHPRVDAYLWIKRPGESDGTCRGGPPAGQWWPSYALELVRNAGG
ncbi:glycoside hydrolase family 6 protein [Streptomyces buecherae]|uniref:glycoside hydrolase family 6 protein n=1 Tax=Streptomyces buecherae TaxID=2763006 RepID=UPI003665538B